MLCWACVIWVIDKHLPHFQGPCGLNETFLGQRAKNRCRVYRPQRVPQTRASIPQAV